MFTYTYSMPLHILKQERKRWLRSRRPKERRRPSQRRNQMMDLPVRQWQQFMKLINSENTDSHSHSISIICVLINLCCLSSRILVVHVTTISIINDKLKSTIYGWSCYRVSINYMLIALILNHLNFIFQFFTKY